MDKSERGELLRARLRALGGYFPIQRRDSIPAKPKPYQSRWKHGSRWGSSVGQHVKEMPFKWVAAADPKPAAPIKPKRTDRRSALTRISETDDKFVSRCRRSLAD